jgi:hypothetical protein
VRSWRNLKDFARAATPVCHLRHELATIKTSIGRQVGRKAFIPNESRSSPAASLRHELAGSTDLLDGSE